jgi:hypothetical protein
VKGIDPMRNDTLLTVVLLFVLVLLVVLVAVLVPW